MRTNSATRASKSITTRCGSPPRQMPNCALEVVVDARSRRGARSARSTAHSVSRMRSSRNVRISSRPDVQADAVDGVLVEDHRVRVDRDAAPRGRPSRGGSGSGAAADRRRPGRDRRAPRCAPRSPWARTAGRGSAPRGARRRRRRSGRGPAGARRRGAAARRDRSLRRASSRASARRAGARRAARRPACGAPRPCAAPRPGASRQSRAPPGWRVVDDEIELALHLGEVAAQRSRRDVELARELVDREPLRVPLEQRPERVEAPVLREGPAAACRAAPRAVGLASALPWGPAGALGQAAAPPAEWQATISFQSSSGSGSTRRFVACTATPRRADSAFGGSWREVAPCAPERHAAGARDRATFARPLLERIAGGA